ncbi:MAG: cytochrome c oxidase subunit II [Deltaproteobacteria bacterium]|nr:cytochrome c oxidase subunit II [Deltaproteobacteria bacterium]
MVSALAALAVIKMFSPAAQAQPVPAQSPSPQTAPQPAPNPNAEGAPTSGGAQSGVTPPVVTQPNPGSTGAGPATNADGGKGTGAAAGAPAPAATGDAEQPWYVKLVNKPVQDFEGGNFWMPKYVNSVTDSSDMMYMSVLALSAFFFFAIAGAVIYLTWRYRHRPGHKAEPSASHNDALEITWTIIPTIITVFLFYYGWRSYIHIVTPPQKAVEINVQAMQWAWSFRHHNGVEDSDLHVPVGTPVRLVMTSRDVLHAFYVPALRTKQDIIPRRYTYVWFNATKPGTYRLHCAEYCGTNHSQMGVTGPTPEWPNGRRAVIVVHESGGYERYLSDMSAGDPSATPEQRGAALYDKKGCVACHTTDGAAKVGPSFKGAFGTDITLADGSKVKVDENYIRESLLYPQAKSRPGFPPTMPSFEGQLKEQEIEGLIAFIKSLK